MNAIEELRLVRMQILCCILILLAVPPYVFCALQHICMNGHLQHGPYEWDEIMLDALWITCFLNASLLAYLSQIRGRTWFAAVPIGLAVSRIFLGNVLWMLYGPVMMFVELPGLVFLALAAVVTLQQSLTKRGKLLQ